MKPPPIPTRPDRPRTAPHVQAALQRKLAPVATPRPAVSHVQAAVQAVQRKAAPAPLQPARLAVPVPPVVRPAAPPRPPALQPKISPPKVSGRVGVVQCVRTGVWNAQNVANLRSIEDEVVSQISHLLRDDNYIVLTVTEVLRGGTDEDDIAHLRNTLTRGYGGSWSVEAVHVGRTALGGRYEYQLVISNFDAESERLRLPGNSSYRAPSVTSWTSTTGVEHSVASYHAFGPGNPDRGDQTTAVRAALRRDHVDVAIGDWNQAPVPLAGYTTLASPHPTTAGGSNYDYAVVRNDAPIGAEGFETGTFEGSDHRLFSVRVGERSSHSSRLRFTTPSSS